MSTITLRKTDFDVLAALALSASVDRRQTQKFIEKLEQDNGITRYRLLVRWQDPNAPAPPGQAYPVSHPPFSTGLLELTRLPVRVDAEGLAKSSAPQAINIMVSKDLEGQGGWHTLDGYFQETL